MSASSWLLSLRPASTDALLTVVPYALLGSAQGEGGWGGGGGGFRGLLYVTSVRHSLHYSKERNGSVQQSRAVRALGGLRGGAGWHVV